MKASIGPYNQGKKRTTKISYSAYDCWDLGSTFARLILPGLKLFRKRAHPAICTAYYDEKLPDEGFSDWMQAIDRMIWSLEQTVADNESPQLPTPIKKATWNPLSNGCWEMIGPEFNEGDYDRYREESAAYRKRVQEGLDLFAKHMGDLWE
jgi:hypothetical protein